MSLFDKFLGWMGSARAARYEASRSNGWRLGRFEQLERRQMLAADIQLGAVYYEDNSGTDGGPDIIEITWSGGAPGTQLTRLVINMDKAENGIDGGDLFFDTEAGGLGVFSFHGMTITASSGFTITSITTLGGSTNLDGSTSVVFTFSGFDAGEKLIFSIDVDEQQDSLPTYNAHAEGAEFENTILEATFEAPGYNDSQGRTRFTDSYDLSSTGLPLPPDSYMPPNPTPTPVRTAGALMVLTPQPLPGSISGRVHVDTDGDCLYDPGETLLSNVTIQLLDTGGNIIATTLTDANGEYSFTNLAPGVYHVREIQPTGYLTSGEHVGSVGGVATTNNLSQIDIGPGVDGVNYDFCEMLPGSISGRVHVDTDGDCLYDPGEVLLSGVTIQLLDGSGNLLATTLTDANGQYSFNDLLPGTYTVREIQPTGYLSHTAWVGSAGGVKISDDELGQITLGPSGVNAVNYDFCEGLPASISGYVFQDGPTIQTQTANGGIASALANLPALRDGVRSSDDTPIAGVTIILTDAAGNVLATTTTNASGFYQFQNLRSGTYTVIEVHPAGYYDSVDTPGTMGGVADNPGDVIRTIVLAEGQNSLENNFSEVRITEIPDPPLLFPPPPQTPPPFVPNPAEPLASSPAPVTPSNPSFQPLDLSGTGRVNGHSWHLSVVNAGQPRTLATTTTVSLNGPDREAVERWEQLALDDAQWTLTLGADEDRQEQLLIFGRPGAIPVVGDFNGDGATDLGVYVNGQWFIDVNGNGVWDDEDLFARLGTRDDLPVTGDWDGDGKTDIGIFGKAWPGDPQAIANEPGIPTATNALVDSHAKNPPPLPEHATDGVRTMQLTSTGTPRADLIDHVFSYGVPGDVPIAGDWDNDGIHTIGVFRDGQWNLDVDGDGLGSANDETFQMGQTGDRPVVGDFNGDGIVEMGIFRDGFWHIDDDNNRILDARDRVFELGGPGDLPAVGDWDGDGQDDAGVFHQGQLQQARRD